MPIQGTSADMMKMAIIKLFSEMPDHTDLIWTVHDSVLLQTPIGNEQDVAEKAKTLMAGVLQLNVPVEVDYKVGYNLADMH
jgi:DNA polymerase-1